jgi:6,7-dimethyl-8-ribityllumazine synthase
MLNYLPRSPRLNTHASHRIVIVASRYNEEFVEPMVVNALQEIHAIGPMIKTEVIHAPGSFEIPFTVRQVIERRKPDGIICLGVILRGETGHADLIAASVSDMLCRLSVEFLIPVIHGVLLLNSREEAQVRCLGEEYNRGIEAARAAVEIIRTARDLKTMKRGIPPRRS